MRILVDLQSLQTPASQRGIGISTRGLANALLRFAPEYQLFFLRKEGKGWAFAAAQPGETEIAGPWGDPSRWESADPLAFMARTGIGVLYMTGAFQPEVKLPPVPEGVRKASQVHDLIPLIMPERYIGGWPQWLRDDYQHRLHYHSQCDLLLCDSQATAQDVRRFLAPAGAVAVSSLAASPDTAPPELPVARDLLAKGLGLREPYILSITGPDYRKNNTGIVAGFAAAGLQRHRLVIVGLTIHSERRAVKMAGQRLGVYPHIQLLNNVPGPLLNALYAGADLLLFPSRYEGFGLPTLESMTCGTPVVGGNNSAFPEIVGEGGLLVNVEQNGAIGVAVRRIASDPAFRAELSHKATLQAARFTWEAVAANLKAAFSRLVP